MVADAEDRIEEGNGWVRGDRDDLKSGFALLEARRGCCTSEGRD